MYFNYEYRHKALPILDTASNENPLVTLADYNNGSAYDRDSHVLYINKLDELNIKEKQMRFEGVEAIYREIEIRKPTFLHVVHPKGFLKMQFEVAGHSDFVPEKNAASSIAVLIPSGHYNGLYMPHIRGQLYYPRSRKCLDVMMTWDYLKGVLCGGENDLGDFAGAVLRRLPCLLHKQAQGITVAMQRCINEIIHPTVSEPLKPAYIQHKLAELILLVADDVRRKSDQHLAPSSVNLDDVSAVINLKQWIDQHVTEQITLPQLARMAGLSPTKLKTAFKADVGLPVMTYVRRQKLQYAYRMLASQQYSVSEVAALINYQHVQHFTTAFKNRYGQLPSTILKRL